MEELVRKRRFHFCNLYSGFLNLIVFTEAQQGNKVDRVRCLCTGCSLKLISIHQFLARARLFPSDILQSHGAYQITLQLHLRKTRASKYSHLLPTPNVFSGGKANSPPDLKAKIAAVIVRVASGFCCRNILIFLKVEGRN